MPAAFDALQNAARLKASPSRANLANYDDIFAGPAEGHVPSAWEQHTGEANQEAAATTLGAGPAFRGLQHAAEAARLGTIDNQLGEEADLGSGRPQRIAGARASMGADVADFTSERGARRSLLPFATDVKNEQDESARELAQTRYVDPAVYKAQGDEAAARMGAAGRVDAARTNHAGDALKGLYNAINTLMEKTGKTPKPEEIALLKQHFGIQ